MTVHFGDDGAGAGAEPSVSRTWDRQPHESFVGFDEMWQGFAAELAPRLELPAAPGGEPPPVGSCELTYVNPILAEDDWRGGAWAESLLLRWLDQTFAGAYLPAPSGIEADATFDMQGAGTAAGGSGRLCVSVRSLVVESPEPLFSLTLSAQGPASGPGLAGVKAFFDTAFEWIVRGFASLAPPPAGAR